MKIAIVTETFLPATDGVVTRFTFAIDYMMRQGHEVIILAPDIEGIPESYSGAKIYPMPAKTYFFYKQRPWSAPTSKVGKVLKDFDPDIVHAVNPVSLAASGVHYAKKFDIPLICSFHTNIPKYLDHYHASTFKSAFWSYLRKLHNSALVNLVTSQSMYDELEENGIHGLEILPVGVDVENRHPRFDSKEMRDRLTEGDIEKKLLIFVGRLAAEKDIQSLKTLLDERDDVRLAIVGDGPYLEKLKSTFAGTQTVFTGFLHGEELSQAYASADAFIFPSTSETLGLVITESMASGTPVIAAMSEPTAEQIIDGENGLIYDKTSTQSFHKALDTLGDDEIMEYIVQNGRNHAKQFSWDNASQGMIDAYELTLSKYAEYMKVN